MRKPVSKFSKSLFVGCLIYLACLSNSTNAKQLTGKTIGNAGNPLPGALVTVRLTDSLSLVVVTDDSGRFSISLPDDVNSIDLSVRSIGHEIYLDTFLLVTSTACATIILEEEPIPVQHVVVSPPIQNDYQIASYNRQEIKRRSQGGVVSDNPVEAIKQPQVVRQGSNHSSKLRVNGTTPRYYFDGFSIGYDPNHYGMFSLIPGALVERIQFYPQGTSAAFESPSVMTMESAEPYFAHFYGEIDFSFVQANGKLSVGNESYFATAAVRKSVLDKLVKQFNVSSERRTIPPTNFQDIAIASGLRLSPSYFVKFDQYDTRDYLAYSTSGTSRNPEGLYTFQYTSEQFAGLRFQGAEGDLLFKAALSYRHSDEEYQASPVKSYPQSLNLNLDETADYVESALEARFIRPQFEISWGVESEYIDRATYMDQINWNMLPPDATDNNAYIYQYELNRDYHLIDVTRKELNSAGFLAVTNRFGRWEWEKGIRWQHYSHVGGSDALLWRNKLTYSFDQKKQVSLFAGSFAESPAKRALEQYQVLVRYDLEQLEPVKTQLYSAAYTHGPVTTGIFNKEIKRLPTLVPVFSKMQTAQSVNSEFVSIKSSESLRFYGCDLALDLDQAINKHLDIYAYYGYTFARKNLEGKEYSYELNAPHRCFLEMTYAASKMLTLGASFSLRSGFAYTPPVDEATYKAETRYTEDYYYSELDKRNGKRFPVNTTLNLSASFNFGDKELYLGVTNALNRSNPLINTSDGYIYDAGILPSVGFKWQF